MEAFQANTVLTCFEKILKSRFVVIGKSKIIYFLRVRRERHFLSFRLYWKPDLASGLSS